MRTIERTTQFRRDYKREIKGRHRATLEAHLTTLVSDTPLAEKFRDHPLSDMGRLDAMTEEQPRAIPHSAT